mgnify:FL=1|tara:strand:- start:6244 stop:6792 length:549 start_codon:yes stop_codon:yes gene_type:complete
MTNVDLNFRTIDSTLKSSLRGGEEIVIPPEMDELYEYWVSKRGKRFAPPVQGFLLNDLGKGVIDRSIMVRVIRPNIDFLFIHWGDERTQLFGKSYNSQLVGNVRPRKIARKAKMEYFRILTTRQPVFVETLVNVSSGLTVPYFALRLPLSEGGTLVDQIITLYVCPVDHDEIIEYYQSKTHG